MTEQEKRDKLRTWTDIQLDDNWPEDKVSPTDIDKVTDKEWAKELPAEVKYKLNFIMQIGIPDSPEEMAKYVEQGLWT